MSLAGHMLPGSNLSIVRCIVGGGIVLRTRVAQAGCWTAILQVVGDACQPSVDQLVWKAVGWRGA